VPQLQGVQGWGSTELSRSQAVVTYRNPLAIRRRFVSNGVTGAEDGVASAFPACWVVAESEAQRVNKMGFKIDTYISLIDALNHRAHQLNIHY